MGTGGRVPEYSRVGDSGGGSCQGTEGHTRGGDRGPQPPRWGPSPALFWGVQGTLSAQVTGGTTDRQTASKPRQGQGWGAPPLYPPPHPQPCCVHRVADGRISDVFIGAINTHNISVLFWRFI